MIFMILQDWYITNERLGIACLTSTSVTTFRATCKIRSRANKTMFSHDGLFLIFFISRKTRVLKSICRRYENNRSAVSSLKSPLDWSWRINTCLTMLRFQFQRRRHVLPRTPSTWSIIVILFANRQILNIHFRRELCIVRSSIKKFMDFSKLYF